MTTQVTTYETPEVTVLLSNLEIDLKSKKFSLDLGTKTKRQKKFRLEKVSGNITNELYSYLTRMTDVKVPVKDGEEVKWIKTGRQATLFQKFLAKKGVDFYPGILKDMTFECSNTSDKYAENPFRLVMLGENNVLTLVNIPSKSKTTVLNQDGTTSTYYKVKKGTFNGKTMRAFIRPDRYRRLVIKTTKEVEVAEVEGYNNSILNK